MGLFSGITHAIGGIAKIVQGNQYRQRQKGLIGQAYREDSFQQGLRQANTRQASNESLNARGVFTAGATPGPIGTGLQQVAASGGKKIAGTGVTPFLTAAGAGSAGAVNTLSGGQNQQMTDQFALEDLNLARGKSTAERANNDQYKGVIGSAIGDTAKAFGFDDGGISQGVIGGAIPNSAMQVNSVDPVKYPREMNGGEMLGAYNMPVNPSFFGGRTQGLGTVVGDGQQNFNFSAPD